MDFLLVRPNKVSKMYCLGLHLHFNEHNSAYPTLQGQPTANNVIYTSALWGECGKCGKIVSTKAVIISKKYTTTMYVLPVTS